MYDHHSRVVETGDFSIKTHKIKIIDESTGRIEFFIYANILIFFDKKADANLIYSRT